MVDEEQATINDLSKKMDMATGAFKATGYLGGALLILTTGIFLYAFNKLEGIDRTQSNHETRISILESKSDLRINARYKK